MNIVVDCSRATDWVQNRTLRLGSRSIQTAAMGESSRNGICSANVASPSRNAEPDSL